MWPCTQRTKRKYKTKQFDRHVRFHHHYIAIPPPCRRFRTILADDAACSTAAATAAAFPHPKTQILSHSGMSALPPPTTHSTRLCSDFIILPLPFSFIIIARTLSPLLLSWKLSHSSTGTQLWDACRFAEPLRELHLVHFAIDFIVCAPNRPEFEMDARASVSIGRWTFSSMHGNVSATSSCHSFSKSLFIRFPNAIRAIGSGTCSSI